MLRQEESSDDTVEDWRLAHVREVFNQATRVVIFTGAGVSRSPPANIPTYEEAGLTFSRAMVESKDARWLSFQDKVRASQPTMTHRFCESLYYEGRLHRVYTQNVDELHEMCLPPHMVVAVHGHALDPATLVCMEEDPWTRNPDLMSNLLSDFPMDQSQHPDMCLVLGTRLAVNPFRWFPNLINPTWCPRFFVNPDLSCLQGARVRTPYGGLCEMAEKSPPVSLRGRKVSTKVEWTTRRSKYHGHQWLIEMEADAFCEALRPLT